MVVLIFVCVMSTCVDEHILDYSSIAGYALS
jgi:hypothetical protein